ncbi:hypothetical protein NUW54_g12228 [Trametes sanguinea]|uniref:Uncharacterized protein n=1 Tax=Trametes sanguinea TaxID=158606 RepID=A0ACC1N0I5_9APHY|nr:hypothetical protein NUW54_g12228 [Trametes sanguinea]
MAQSMARVLAERAMSPSPMSESHSSDDNTAPHIYVPPNPSLSSLSLSVGGSSPAYVLRNRPAPSRWSTFRRLVRNIVPRLEPQKPNKRAAVTHGAGDNTILILPPSP